MVTAVFRAWQQAGINWLVLRNYEGLPEFTTNDIDVLVGSGQLREAEQALLAAAKQTGFRVHNRVEFATLALYLSSRQSNAQAHFDLFTTLKWRGFEFVACDGFLQRKVSRDLFFIPHLADETATKLLASLIYTGKVKEKYKPSIVAGFQAERAAITDLLTPNLRHGRARSSWWLRARRRGGMTSKPPPRLAAGLGSSTTDAPSLAHDQSLCWLMPDGWPGVSCSHRA